MKKTISLVATGYLILSSTAWAGHEVKNGGDAVVCYTATDRQTITSVQSFDYWEGQAAYPVSGGISLGSANTLKQKINISIERLRGFDQERARKIGDIANSIVDHIANYLVTGAQLPEIEDAHPRLIPNSPCYIEQFAVQWKDPVTGQRRFSISDRFYNDPTATDEARAGIILHEAFYRIAILDGATNSDGVRYMNYLFSTEFFNGKNQDDYDRAYLEANINPSCSLQELNKGLRKMVVKPTPEQPGFRTLCTPYKIELPKFKFELAAGEEFYNNPGSSEWWSGDHRTNVSFLTAGAWTNATAREGQVINYNQDGSISGLYIVSGDAHIQFGNTDLACDSDTPIDLQNDGSVSGCALKPGQVFVDHGHTLYPRTIYFAPDYVLSSVVLDQPAVLPIAGSNVTVNVAHAAYFNKNGELTAAKGFVTPLPVTVMGRSSTTDWFYTKEKTGEIVAPEVVTSALPEINGKRVGYFKDEPYMAWAYDNVCESLGLGGVAGYSQNTKSTKTYISTPEDIFVLDEKRVKNITDQELMILSPNSIQCVGDFVVHF